MTTALADVLPAWTVLGWSKTRPGQFATGIHNCVRGSGGGDRGDLTGEPPGLGASAGDSLAARQSCKERRPPARRSLGRAEGAEVCDRNMRS